MLNVLRELNLNSRSAWYGVLSACKKLVLQSRRFLLRMAVGGPFATPDLAARKIAKDVDESPIHDPADALVAIRIGILRPPQVACRRRRQCANDIGRVDVCVLSR